MGFFNTKKLETGRMKVVLLVVILVVALAILIKKNVDNPILTQSGENKAEVVNVKNNTSPIRNTADPRSCEIKSLQKKSVQGMEAYSPDGKKYVLNKEDSNGVGQIYLGTVGKSDLKCITCTQLAGGPAPSRYKTQATWHPSGKWIIFSVERDEYTKPPIIGESREFIEGMIRSGLFVNTWAMDAKGEKWFQLTDFKDPKWGETSPNGITGPIFSKSGKRAVWSQIVDGNILAYSPFGRWELILSDFDDKDGVPKLVNRKNITPTGMHWNEPGNFGPDENIFIFTGSDLKDQQGMDQYLFDIRSSKLTNLTNSPTVWDEHGRLSPDGKKVIFMTAYPYRSDPNSSKVLSIKTDFMMMDSDGKNLKQITHFRTAGYPESSEGIAANGEWNSDGSGAQLRQLVFPNYVDWAVEFDGPCGKQ